MPPTTSISLLMRIVMVTQHAILLSYKPSIQATTTKTLKATLTCDQTMTVYIDGKYAGTNRGKIQPMRFTLHPGTRVLAVKCVNHVGEAGILGSLDNALVTDSRWKCTGRTRRNRLKRHWMGVLYDDSLWAQAVEYFPNRGWTIWGNIGEISEEASWIWTADKGKHEETYCRRRVSDVSVKQEHAHKGIFHATLHEVGHVLLLHARAQHEVQSIAQCAQRCREDSRCLSFNFQHDSSSLVKQCELKDATRNQDPKNYIKRNGYTYYESIGDG